MNTSLQTHMRISGINICALVSYDGITPVAAPPILRWVVMQNVSPTKLSRWALGRGYTVETFTTLELEAYIIQQETTKEAGNG